MKKNIFIAAVIFVFSVVAYPGFVKAQSAPASGTQATIQALIQQLNVLEVQLARFQAKQNLPAVPAGV